MTFNTSFTISSLSSLPGASYNSSGFSGTFTGSSRTDTSSCYQVASLVEDLKGRVSDLNDRAGDLKDEIENLNTRIGRAATGTLDGKEPRRASFHTVKRHLDHTREVSQIITELSGEFEDLDQAAEQVVIFANEILQQNQAAGFSSSSRAQLDVQILGLNNCDQSLHGIAQELKDLQTQNKYVLIPYAKFLTELARNLRSSQAEIRRERLVERQYQHCLKILQSAERKAARYKEIDPAISLEDLIQHSDKCRRTLEDLSDFKVFRDQASHKQKIVNSFVSLTSKLEELIEFRKDLERLEQETVVTQNFDHLFSTTQLQFDKLEKFFGQQSMSDSFKLLARVQLNFELVSEGFLSDIKQSMFNYKSSNPTKYARQLIEILRQTPVAPSMVKEKNQMIQFMERFARTFAKKKR